MNVATEEVRETILSRFQAAYRSIDIICFEVSSADVIEALRKRSEEGISVRVRCEHRKTGTALLDVAEAAPSIQLQRSEPNKEYHALHEKIVLIDDNRLLFGTFNLSDVSFDQNAELLFETTEPKLIAAAREHVKGLDHSLAKSGKVQLSTESTEVRDTQETRRFLSIPNLPAKTSHLLFSSDYELFETIRSAIESARHSIIVYASHRISERILELLCDAEERGTAVKVIKDVSALQSWDLRRIGRKVTRAVSVPGKMHIKAILIDDESFLVGSVNLFERSLFQDRELLFVGNDAHTRRLIDRELVNVNELSKPISTADHLRFIRKQLNRTLRRVARKTARRIGVQKSQ